MEKDDLIIIQNSIGYEFENIDLLEQAFVRRSYSQENGGENNEVLEFIGDKVLDFIVVKLLTEKYGAFIRDLNPEGEFNDFTCRYQEGKLTELKKKLVERDMLAHRIDVLELSDYLIMGQGDIKRNVKKEKSVKEDLFESILGAVALDSSWNIEEIQNVVDVMLDPDYYLFEDESENFFESIREWTLKEYNVAPKYKYKPAGPAYQYGMALTTLACCLAEPLPEGMSYFSYNYYSLDDGVRKMVSSMGISTKAKADSKIECLLKLGEFEFVFRGFGKTKIEARREVSELAYNYLEWKDLLDSIQDEIDNPNRAEAVNQLETLARRGYFSIPTYRFKQEYDNNGNPIWKCECHIEEEEKYFRSQASTKKEAKKNVAYEMLKYILK